MDIFKLISKVYPVKGYNSCWDGVYFQLTPEELEQIIEFAKLMDRENG